MSQNKEERKKNNEIGFYKSIPQTDLLGIQFEGFNRLFTCNPFYVNRNKELLYDLLKKIFPIKSKTEDIQIDVIDYFIKKCKYSYTECIEQKLSYTASLTIKFSLKKKNEKDVWEETIENFYIGEIPMMTEYGTFVYNGIERVGVSQLKKTTGISFFCDGNEKKNIKLCLQNNTS